MSERLVTDDRPPEPEQDGGYIFIGEDGARFLQELADRVIEIGANETADEILRQAHLLNSR